jgi:C-terminal processing protease CtpA/Prc
MKHQHAIPMLAILAVTGLTLASLFAVPAVAGGDHGQCTADAQSCLDKLVASAQSRGWLGVEMDRGDDASLYTITRVVPDSPAEQAGFQAGDVFAGFAGLMLADASDEARKEAKARLVAGATIDYVVLRDGEEQTLTATLTHVPDDVMAQWVGAHMVEHAEVASLND